MIDARRYIKPLRLRTGPSSRPVAQDLRTWELCCQHLTHRAIGAELGSDPSTAYDAVQRAAQMIPTMGAVEMNADRQQDPLAPIASRALPHARKTEPGAPWMRDPPHRPSTASRRPDAMGSENAR